jgi:hypothetical protein
MIVIGILAGAIFLGLNQVHFRMSRYLNQIHLGYYSSLKLLQVSKAGLIGFSIDIEQIALEQLEFLMIFNVLISGAGAQLVRDSYKAAAKSWILWELEGHLKIKEQQFSVDYNKALNLYSLTKETIEKEKGLIPQELLVILKAFEAPEEKKK